MLLKESENQHHTDSDIMYFRNNGITTILILSAVILVAGIVTGCEDQLLNKTPRGELTQASFFKTEDQAVEATNATYQILRDFNVHSFPWLGMTDMTSDDADKGSTPADAPFLSELDNFTFDATNGAFSSTWQAYYQGVYRANLAIKNIPGIDMDEELRSRLVAENKFLRAYFYFFLVRAFGGVPLITEPLAPSEFEQPRASAQEVYSRIEQDLEEAIAALPLKSEYAPDDAGRATKGAAQAMLAKVHLFQQEYQEAEQYAEEVIDSQEYSLYPDYGEIFTEAGENSSETVFEVQAVAVETSLGGTPYSVVQGVRGQPNLGWGFNTPTRDLLEAYEDGDPRMESTILFVNEELPDGTDAVRDNPNMSDERYNQKPYVPLDNPGGTFNGGQNIRRFRYADVLLIAAEAAFQNGNISDAQTYVNMVRERARGGQTATVGLHVEPVSEFVADTVGMASLTGRPLVRYADSGSPAASAGISNLDWTLADNNAVLVFNTMDVIQSVNGTGVSTVAEFNNEMASVAPGQPVTLGVQRITETFDAGSGTKTTGTQTDTYVVTAEALLPDITDVGQDLRDAIWHERRIELAMEQQRFFDLRRQGRAGEVLRALGKQYEDGKHDLFPIPRQEIELNPMLEQNPGYQ